MMQNWLKQSNKKTSSGDKQADNDVKPSGKLIGQENKSHLNKKEEKLVVEEKSDAKIEPKHDLLSLSSNKIVILTLMAL